MNFKHPHNFQDPVRRCFRSRRLRGFAEKYISCHTIVDVGGEHTLWEIVGRKEGVVVVNLSVPKEHGDLPHVLADGCNLPFGDKSIDLAFSNFRNRARGKLQKPGRIRPGDVASG